jgi:hypothetical protein
MIKAGCNFGYYAPSLVLAEYVCMYAPPHPSTWQIIYNFFIQLVPKKEHNDQITIDFNHQHLSCLCGLIVLSSWLQIERSEFDSRRYQIFWEVVDLEWGSLSLVSTVEELLERKSSGSGLESREDSHRDPSH